MLPLLNSIDASLMPWLHDHGQGGYRLGQIRNWLFARRATSFDAMTDLPQKLRGELATDFTISTGSYAGLV